MNWSEIHMARGEDCCVKHSLFVDNFAALYSQMTMGGLWRQPRHSCPQRDGDNATALAEFVLSVCYIDAPTDSSETVHEHSVLYRILIDVSTTTDLTVTCSISDGW